jgi:hypothetical protein
MEEYISLNPVDISFFGSIAVMPHADRLANLIEELGFR